MPYDFPHRRFNPLTNEWVLVSPHRALRPWLGQVEKTSPENLPAYDPTCYLCPGNQRVGDRQNPEYPSTYVFDNDFPALLAPQQSAVEGIAAVRSATEQTPGENLFLAQPESGICRVVCFSPRHDLTLPELPIAQVKALISTWSEQTQALGSLEFIKYVQVFENKGAMMGCSNPHPHSQVWATSQLPNEPAKELAAQIAYAQQHQSCLLCDYLAAEQKNGERILTENAHFTALVPFWATWPFEVMIISRRHCASLPELTAIRGASAALAEALRQVTARYDNLFEISFPYSMGFHQAPTDGSPHPEWHLHLHFFPPLLRSATVRKFMVGYEMLAEPQRDLTPEAAAQRLRNLPSVHYKTQNQK